jgi:hypothetical protein
MIVVLFRLFLESSLEAGRTFEAKARELRAVFVAAVARINGDKDGEEC